MADPVTTAAKTVIPETTKVRENQLTVVRLKLQEHRILKYQAVCEAGTLEEDLLRQEFWAHVASQLKPYTEITAHTDDGTWWARLLVLSAGRTWAKVKMLEFVPLTTSDVDQSEFFLEGHTIKYRGDHNKFAVVRIKDGAIVQEKFDSFTTAQAWLKEYLDKPLA